MIIRTSGSSPSNKPDESGPELEKEKGWKTSGRSDKDEALLKLVRSHLHACPICKTEADWAVVSGATDRVKCPKCEAVWVVSEGGMKLFEDPREGFQIDLFMYKAFEPWSFWQRLPLKEEEQIEGTTKLWKYFAQGILFSAIFIALLFVWIFLLLALMVIGSIIGLIIGFLILLFLIGFLNAFLTDAIWNIDIRADWKSLLSHGFFLFIALLFANIPAYLINLVMHSLPIEIVLFIVYCFIDGYISKKVAESYEITEHETRETTEYKTPPKPPWIHSARA